MEVVVLTESGVKDLNLKWSLVRVAQGTGLLVGIEIEALQNTMIQQMCFGISADISTPVAVGQTGCLLHVRRSSEGLPNIWLSVTGPDSLPMWIQRCVLDTPYVPITLSWRRRTYDGKSTGPFLNGRIVISYRDYSKATKLWLTLN